MALKIKTASERMAEKQKANIALFAPSGWGKTYQARTLDPETTLFVDLEAGTLSLNGDKVDGSDAWQGSIVSIREEAQKLGVHPWEMARAIICMLGGADPAAAPGTPYAADQLAIYEQMLGERSMFDQFNTVFIDSITVASRLCFSWAKRQPDAFNKDGKPDTRGAYGILGQEMMTWLTQAQHIPGKSIIVVGILDTKKDDFGVPEHVPQIEGSKAGRELVGIFDQVITGAMFDVSSGTPTMDNTKGTERGFVCHLNNGYGVPAKDRSGRLALIEAPDLGAILKKVQGGPRIDTPSYAAPGGVGSPTDQVAETQQ